MMSCGGTSEDRFGSASYQRCAALLGSLLLALVTTHACADPARSLIGTWGIPPDDASRFVNGSYFSVYRNDAGELNAEADLGPKEWRCGFRSRIVWNEDKHRFEWPNGDASAASSVCWFTAVPDGDRLQTTLKCSYQCTDPQHEHVLLIDKIADAHLQPPKGASSLFCASHNPLRQQLCAPGALQDAVRHAVDAAQRSRGLGTDDVAKSSSVRRWDTTQSLLAIIAECSDTDCVMSRIDTATRSMQSAAIELLRVLEREKVASKAAEMALVRAEDQNAWIGEWKQNNEKMNSTLRIGACDAQVCHVTIEAETNYTWGYTEHRGGCGLEDLAVHFTGTHTAYGYIEPEQNLNNAENTESFADYCRLDLTRIADGAKLDLRGPGCSNICTQAPVDSVQGTFGAEKTAASKH